jgi:DNA-binding Lrp family transcriptional regulator
MDEIDRSIINELQGGFPVAARPYAQAAKKLGIQEAELLARLRRLLDNGTLSRFGPLYDAERLGGALSLCAMQVPEDRYERIAALINAFPEVAHNYAREHELNMWFVLATETSDRLGEVIEAIEGITGLALYHFPKEAEFFIGLRLQV